MKQAIDPTNYAAWLSTAQDCRNLIFQSLDLTADDDRLSTLPQATIPEDNCIYLGCTLGHKLADLAADHHALIFPQLPNLPFNPFRHELHTVDELFHSYDPALENGYQNTEDWKIYKSYIKVGAGNKPLSPVQFVEAGLDEIVARRLHDTFIHDELENFLNCFRGPNQKGIIAIMGGHDKKRSDPDFKRVAALARNLTLDGYLIASGGGPGFMEAANLGAFFATQSEQVMFDAIDTIATPTSDSYYDKHWLSAAWNLRTRFLPPDWTTARSLGIPTWFYGHEPPNIFASHIAKYFENSHREEGLLAIATHGVIFAEGNAGTVQEIFQDACQNYYINYAFRSPMILFGKDYWNPKPLHHTEDGYPVYANAAYPAYPLLLGLAQKKGFTHLLMLTDDPVEVLDAIRAFPHPW